MIDSIIYIRTSTEDQNPQNQIKDCETLLEGEYELFEDKQSAFKDNKDREGFEKAKKLMKSGKIKHFIVWDLDRIYRNRIKLKQFLEFLKIYGVKLHSFRQVWMEELHKVPEPWNEIVYDLMVNIYGYIGEDESKKKSDRVKLAVRKKKGITKSYKGNKWGRKAMHTNKINRIIKLGDEGKSYREIHLLEKVSIGKISQILSVHKSSEQISTKKPQKI